MESLQGPSLLAFSDKPFTQEDIQGIQKLGEGSKRVATYKTGRYGVGFNVVYHLTDCPMFMSGGDQICVMDPTLQYVPGANVKSPGRMYTDVRSSLREICPDFLECFLSFSDHFQLDQGTLFRLPLRRKESELSDKEWSTLNVQTLLDGFKEEIFDVLLFLKSVKKISISTREKECKDLRNAYTVEAHFTDQAISNRMSFYKHLSDHANTPLTQVPPKNNCDEVIIKSSDGYQEQWLVQQCIGLDDNTIPSSITKASQSGSIEKRLLPKGGVAALLSRKHAEEKSDYKDVSRLVEYKAFCFLPLPLPTKLPVHVDGYFALDHEARRNLWYGPKGDRKSDWNKLIKEKVISRAYVELLLEVKKRVITLVEGNRNRRYVMKVLTHFHTLFPKCDRQEKFGDEDPWNSVSRNVYQEISRRKFDLFPVMKHQAMSDSEKEVEVNWKSCMENANESGYFDDLFSFNYKGMEDAKELDWKILQELLLRLGFPLLSTPFTVYHAMIMALGDRDDDSSTDEGAAKSVQKVSSDNVINFLKEKALHEALKGVPKELKETPIKTNKHLNILIQYVKNTENYETKLDGLPLLLTCDGILRIFSKFSKVFSSEFQSLLPNCKHEFLHEQFRSSISKESNVFANFEVSDLAKRLSTHLDDSTFCGRDLVPWSHGSLVRRNKVTPSVDWLRQFWKFVWEKVKEQPLVHRESFIRHCIQHLGRWALIPVKVRNEEWKSITYLMSVERGKAVLHDSCNENKSVYDILVKLQCPVLDLAVMEQKTTHSISTYFFNPPSETFYEILTSFVTRIENRSEMLQVLDFMLKMNYERFAILTKDECKQILKHMAKCSTDVLKKHANTVLKRLPCYETIQGHIVALDRKAYSIAISDLPTDGNEVWLGPSKSIFLRKDKLPSDLSEALDVEELDEVELYRQFIFPYFTSFSENTMWYHIERIMYMVFSIYSESEQQILINKLNLPHIPLIKSRNGQIKAACELFDPGHDVFKVMLTDDCFPSKFGKDPKRWLEFLQMIGMKTEVTVSQFLKFAEEASIDGSNEGNNHEKQKDRVLFEHFRRNHKLHTDDHLLDKLTNLSFISSYPPNKKVCQLFNPTLAKKVTASATLAAKCALVWTIEPLCPDWVNAQREVCINRRKENCLKKWKEKLGVNTKPSLTDVLRHTQTLCNHLTDSADSAEGKAVTFFAGDLINVMRDILQFLSNQCENISKKEGRLREPRKGCSSKVGCCQNCKLIVEQLESVPFVPVDEGKVLTKANMVVKNLIPEENCNIFMYLKKLPDTLVPYYNTLQCIGATDQPTLEQYARVLESISTVSKVNKEPNLIAAVKQAMSGFLRCLHRKQHDERTKELLLQMPNLYFLSKSEEQPIVISSGLFYNDAAQFNKRLSDFPHPLLKAISQEEFGTAVNVDELLKTLPEHLRPRFISEFVEERMVTAVEDAPKERCQCPVSKKLRKVVEWEQFPVAIQCIVAYEMKTENRGQTDENIEELLSYTFTIKCVEKLETALFFENREIPQSQSDTTSLFVKNQEQQEIVIYISHDTNPSNMYRKLAKNFNDIFKLVRDISYLELILRAENEEDLSNLLNSEGIGTAGLEEESFWNPPELGSNIQGDVVALLNQDVMYIFYENEFVGFDYNEGDNELFIYARVVTRIEDGSCNEKPWKIQYKVKIGNDEIRIMPAHRLYKFITVRHKDCFAVTVYNGRSGDSSESKTVPPTEKPEETTNEYQDLGSTKREVTRVLEDIMTMSETDKTKIIRRLLLKWHPDKNLSNKEFAEEIFKHIQTELDRLQNMNTSSHGNFYDDVHQRARRYEEARKHWEEQYRASSSSRNTRGRSRQRQRDYDFYPPPSFHRKKNTVEGRRHLKQARVDFDVADGLENSLSRCQWKCQLYFFASEKAIKGAQLASGRNTSLESGILKAVESLRDELNLVDQVRGLTSIVKKDSHYPESSASYTIPQEEFTPEQAEKARIFSWNILRAVGRFIEYDEEWGMGL